MLRAASVRDRPRFAWRGLMIDASRHFVPVEALERQLDLMEAVKLNVLHLHLTDDEGFRLESRLHPRLHGEGSGGEYYTQEQVRALVARARDRGIRVVPEIDVPAHTKSWLVGEVAGLFPDAFLHIGGDEVASPEWDASPSVQAFMKAHGIADRRGLHAYFSRRVEAIVARHGRTMVGWDEVLGHGLTGSAVVQTWRSSKLMARATAAGRRTVVSGGYYLDWLMPSAFHYAIDPADPRAYGMTPREAEALKGTPQEPYVGEANVLDETATLTPEQELLILGGEAAMWTELVTGEMLDGRIWPRTAAIAERLWSPREVRDADWMERRLVVVGHELERLGSRHEADPRLMVERMAPRDPDVLLALWSAVEPARFYSRLMKRMMGGPAAQLAPLNRMADAAVPESLETVGFRLAVQDMVAKRERTGPRVDRVRARLAAWRGARAGIEALPDQAPGADELLPVADDLHVLATGGLAALDAWQRGAPVGAEAVAAALAVAERHAAAQATSQVGSLTRAPLPAEVDLAVAPSVRALILAAGSPAGPPAGPGSAPSP